MIPTEQIEKLTFKKFITTIGNLPSSYVESLSYYECMLWLCNYLENTVIPAINNNGEAVEELQGLYVQLKNYVDSYFDTLDVQKEINNKLDDMVRDGTLTSLISAYLDPIITDQDNRITNIENTINTLNSGGPRGVFATVTDLVNEDPDHDYIYLVTADGKWYYYDSEQTNWVGGGVYQATGITDGSIMPEKTIMWNINNLLPLNNWITGRVININTGTSVSYDGCYNEKFVPINSEYICAEQYRGTNVWAYFYDDEYTYISSQHLDDYKRAIPAETAYVRFSIWNEQYTTLPDNYCKVFTIENYNNLVLPYDIKSVYEPNIIETDKFKLYSSYFKLQGQVYGNSNYISIVSINSDNSITYHVNNNSNATQYLGFYIRANLKTNDTIKLISESANNDQTYYLYPVTNLNPALCFTIRDGYQDVVVTSTMIDGNQGINLYRITQGYPAGFDDDVTVTVYINDYPKQFNELIEKPETLSVIALGDSITALTSTRSWLTYFNEVQKIDVIQNVAVNGAQLYDKNNTVYDGNPVWNGPDNNENNVLGNQVQKILNNSYSDPDIIMIAIGTNGGINCTEQDIYNSYYDSNGDLIPLNNVNRKTSAGAFRWCNTKLREKYPNATIFWCSPIQGANSVRSLNNIITYSKNLELLTKYASVQFIDTEKCGITGYTESNGSEGLYLVDGLHPNANGAKYMGYYNVTKVKEYCDSALKLQ